MDAFICFTRLNGAWIQYDRTRVPVVNKAYPYYWYAVSLGEFSSRLNHFAFFNKR